MNFINLTFLVEIGENGSLSIVSFQIIVQYFNKEKILVSLLQFIEYVIKLF